MEELQDAIAGFLCAIGLITVVALIIVGLMNMLDGITFNIYKYDYCVTKFNNKTEINKCKSKSIYKFMIEYLK